MENYSKKSKYWDKTAKKQKQIKTSLTHSDNYLPLLESNAIASFVDNNSDILEIGCGACDNSGNYISKARQYTGVDLIDTFIDIAKEKSETEQWNNVKLITSDGLNYVNNNSINANCIITQRFIINLIDKPSQIQFFKSIKRNIKHNYVKVIICEGFADELNNLNILRNIAGLPPIEIAHYNNFIDNAFLKEIERIGFRKIDEINFNTYFLFTRIFNNKKYNPNELNFQNMAYNMQKTNILDINNNISYSKVIAFELNL